MEQITPLSSLVVGLLIGLAASLLVVLNGKVADISGILNGLLFGPNCGGRTAFVLGLVLAPGLSALVTNAMAMLQMQTAPPALITAGVLAGFGTRLDNGCTAGHDVCGMTRGSSVSYLSHDALFYDRR